MSLRKQYFEWTERHVSLENCHTYQAQFLQKHCSELSSLLWDIESDCKCQQNLRLSLHFTPSLVFRWRRFTEPTNIQITQMIVENVQHLDIITKERAFDYQEVAFYRSFKNLKSVYFRNIGFLSMFFCYKGGCTDKQEENQVERPYKNNLLISVKASLGDGDIKFLTSDKFSESGIKRLNIFTHEWMHPGYQLSGKGWCDTALRMLTHLTVCGEILTASLVNELICGLFVVFKDPLREPMKYLCLGFNGRIRLQFDVHNFSGQTYAVEEFEILHTEIEEEDEVSMLVQFLQCNRSLSHLYFNDTSITLPQGSSAVLDSLADFIVKSNLRVLATPVVHGFDFDVYKILSNAPEMTYLKVLGPGTIEHMQDFIAIVGSHKYISTMSLQEIVLGEAGKDLLAVIMTSENSSLSNLDLRFCGIQGEDFIAAAKTASESCCRHKLHILDISMNRVNRQQQTTIKRLYKNLTDILMVDIPDRPQMEFVAQM
ncbi:uncharacterized protein LOC123549442 [Mercenaria mercenaria]|uniref:uncharacterized protein LOC123549442 n=1 Tax=Mercenaria mercenaria TaxID=6596 RepID=UPI00234F3F21|nr:uncharacterized protein LOC123549442 [Mercenaria mercenaria]